MTPMMNMCSEKFCLKSYFIRIGRRGLNVRPAYISQL